MLKYFNLFRLKRQSKRAIREIQAEFDVSYYLQANPDVAASKMDPLYHYSRYGWREGRNPRSDFDTNAYLRQNLDVLHAGINPFLHYIKYGRLEGRLPNPSQPTSTATISEAAFPVHNIDRAIARSAHYVQNHTFPLEAERAEKLLIVLVPEHNAMSGGIYSFFSIAKTAYHLSHKHDYFVLVMTRPNQLDVTYTRQTNFRNSEDVFRFEQIQRCRLAKTVYLLIPEYATVDFVENLSPELQSYLRSRERFYVNILNQKTDIMPEQSEFEDLRSIATELTQSVAHHAYFGQIFADRYNLPTLLLPAYTDLSEYPSLEFNGKENLIIYSPDDSPFKSDVLMKIQQELPEYELKEVRGVTFDKFMELATRCRFSITFGEGFDGYLAQPILQGGIGFAVYNEEFFPSKELKAYRNIFSSAADITENIVARIKMFENDPATYKDVNQAMVNIYDKLYSKDDYVYRVEKLINREFELYPLSIPLSFR